MSLSTTPTHVFADVNLCQLKVPDAPLSAAGLATPWELQPGCSESNGNQAVFVQAVIFDPATKTLSAYSPLVIDAGTTPAIAPVAPTLPDGAVVAIFGGGNDDVTMLIDPAGACVNGADGMVFGQVFFCGAQNFFAVVNAAHITIPPLGIANDGTTCPTVRDFRIVDQDQSDNVQTTYLVLPNGQTAQNTAANRATLAGVTVAKNASDNSLLTKLVDPAIGCHPWTIPDLADNGAPVLTQAADELQAAAFQAGPVALIPAGDPMVGPGVFDMVNAYRVNVDQPAIHALGEANTVPYCSHIKNAAPAFIAAHQAAFMTSPSPAARVNLYDFMVARLAGTRVILGCK